MSRSISIKNFNKVLIVCNYLSCIYVLFKTKLKMKRLFITLILFIAGFNLPDAIASDPINISISKWKKEERDVKNFNGIAAGGPLTVIVTLDNTESLRFEGDADAISTLVTEVKSNILIIRPETSWISWARKYENKKIVVYVTAKSLKSLTMSGNGNLTVNGKIQGNNLTTTLSGSGVITATAEIDNYVAVISGSGNMNLLGSANTAKFTISGSGVFNKKEFAVDELTAVMSGSGKINIAVNESINAIISGSASINYIGNPDITKKISGSGRVRKI